MESALYYRIKNCRRHVKKKAMPPLPKSQPRERKRRHTSQLQPYRGQAQMATRTPTAPMATVDALISSYDDAHLDGASAVPQILGGITSSPAATLHSNPSTTDFLDFALQHGTRVDIPAHHVQDTAPSPNTGPALPANGSVPMDLDSIVQYESYQQALMMQTISTQPNDMCDASMYGAVAPSNYGIPELYIHCRHGLPINYRISHCTICPKLVYTDAI